MKHEGTDFEQAVLYAKSLFEMEQRWADDDLVRMDDLAKKGFKALRDDPERLLEHSKKSAEAFDLLKHGLALNFRLQSIAAEDPGSVDLSPEMNRWLADCLEGIIQRPAPKRGRREVNPLLQGRIAIAVGALKAQGMHPTRNDASDATSGCDAVAEALKQLGMAPRSYEHVKKIWLKAKSADHLPRAFL